MEGFATLCYTVLDQEPLSGQADWRCHMAASSTNFMGQQPFLTPQEIADRLRVSVYTVRRWIKEGHLPAYKVGRGWRISESAIDDWLERHHSAAVTRY
jgi:excisionase family DNA binding protein